MNGYVPRTQITVASVNQFISDFTRGRKEEDVIYYSTNSKSPKVRHLQNTQGDKVSYSIWYKQGHPMPTVFVQIRADFEKKTKDRQLGISTCGNEVCWSFGGKTLSDKKVSKEQKKLVRDLFILAHNIKPSLSSEENQGHHYTEMLSTSDHMRYSLISQSFVPPENDRILEQLCKSYKQSYNDEFEKKGEVNFLEVIDSSQAQKPISQLSQNIIDSPQTQKAIYQLSQSIFRGLEDNFIFSIGQEPAWFAAMAQINHPDPEGFTFVAFSGDWYDANLIRKPEDSAFTINEDKLATDEQFKAYQSYLKRIGCSPSRIMGLEKPAVFVCYVEKGSEMKCFFEFLFLYAEREGISRQLLRSKLIIRCLYTEINPNLFQEKCARSFLKDMLEEYSFYPISPFSIVNALNVNEDPRENNILELFFKKNNCSDDVHHLVKYFPPSKWTVENCKDSSFAKLNGKLNPYIHPLHLCFWEIAKNQQLDTVPLNQV